MKKFTHIMLFAFVISLFTSNNAFAGSQKMKLTCSQPDAEIFVDGRLIGKGAIEIKVPDEGCTIVEIKKEGYIFQKIEFCNKKKLTKLPNKFHFSLVKDEAFDATISSDIINVDINIPAKNGKDDAWKLINQIVLNNFDAIEMSDKETGYLRTAWVVKRFENSAVRTCFVVKEFSSNPLIFRIKLSSEHTQNKMANANAGEFFKEWNRVLKQYTAIVSEIQARVK